MAKTGRRGKGDERIPKTARVSALVTPDEKKKLTWLSLHLNLSIAELIGQWTEEAFRAVGEVPTATSADSSSMSAEETLQLLIDFINYLLLHHDHDGYSLSEISQILGQPDDRALVALIQKLQQNGNNQPKAKTR